MIHQFEVDGVPAIFSPSTGPTRAGLVFRVGFADETLPRAGITHLLEHLALHRIGREYHSNGTTTVEHTSFHMQGSNGDVVAFLTGVCAALTDLPMDRMPVEKDLLRAEAARRRPSVYERMALWRHGAVDYGVSGYPETGLAAITENDLREWAARYFTRDNAVLWVTGPAVPEGLRLALPAGQRRPCPQPSSALPVTPAWFGGTGDAVAWSTVVPHSPAAEVFADLLERSMFRDLRTVGGISYTAATSMQRMGPNTMILGYADAVPDSHQAVLGGMIDVLAAFGAGRIDRGDLALSIRPDIEEDLPEQALNVLAGRPVQSAEQRAAQIAAVTADDIVAVARTAYAAGLLMVPDGTSAQWAGYVTAPLWSEETVSGTAYPARTRRKARLIVAPDGVSLVAGEQPITVRFAACALYRAWPDGARQLIGHDAIAVHIEPELFRNGVKAIAELDARVPAGLRVDEPPRSPEAVPVVRLRDRLPRFERFHLMVALLIAYVITVTGLVLWQEKYYIQLIMHVTFAALAFRNLRNRRAQTQRRST
ncbi:M16 family metallopeptidase [Actinoplanes derwentensis]|uniref:Zinc protease n=1 Tax=Actinoplanes derwentensis TaxID=113562 RepID=A0A1H1RGK9_9ACTN|nr:insulinase family protein [Actinoplanes derwentensis]GID89409.1 hypothetical protein Ade03nite_83330 [Actinoplanes derwentensis]SDS34825.1 zinc protease [Actinoplanes derwentensis]